MSKGLGLYVSGMEQLQEAVSKMCAGNLNDIVDGDADRQDKVFAIQEGISVDAKEVISWIEEYNIEHAEEA